MTDNAFAPVGGIQIQGADGSIAFVPADDITAKESALIMQMFLNGLMYRKDKPLDFGGYILANNLQRHFVQIKAEAQEAAAQ